MGAKCFRCAEVLLQSEEIGLCATGRGVMIVYEAGAALVQDFGADFATQPLRRHYHSSDPLLHGRIGH